MSDERLDRWRLGLDDQRFARAWAALGALAALPDAALHALIGNGSWDLGQLPTLILAAEKDGQGLLPWKPASTLSSRSYILWMQSGDPALLSEPWDEALRAPALDGAWQAYLARRQQRTSSAPLRLAVQGGNQEPLTTLQTMELLRQPAVGAGSVFQDDAFAADGRIAWRWPFVVGALPSGDLPAALLRNLKPHRPDYPIQYATLSRESPRVEVLVVQAGPDRAMQLLLGGPPSLRASLVVLAGRCGLDLRASESLLRALAATVGAEGVVWSDRDIGVDALAFAARHFAEELTHNHPLDIAVAKAWPDAHLVLSRDLLTVGSLQHALDRVTKDLRGLSKERSFSVSLDTMRSLRLPTPEGSDSGLPTSSPGSPAGTSSSAHDLAEALDAVRHDFNFAREVDEAMAVAELTRHAHDARAEAARHTDQVRHVRQESWEDLDGRPMLARDGYVTGRPVTLRVIIGPRQPDAVTADRPFPTHRLPPDPMGHRLTVMFHEPRQFEKPLVREIHLPVLGDSEAAVFQFTPREAGRFEGRVTILHRGRVLQTLLLSTFIVAPGAIRLPEQVGLTLTEELRVRGDLEDLRDRPSFDLAVILNHTTDGVPRSTALKGNQSWATDLRGIEQPVRKLNELISNVALSEADHAAGLDQDENPKLLTRLAQVGHSLYAKLYRDQLKPLASPGFDVGDEAVEYLQVVTARADTVVPLEFFYDFNPPLPGATVCPQHRLALEQGKCPKDCARVSNPQGHVCPMGFWGLRKVIERHMFDARTALPDRAELLIRSEPSADRPPLQLDRGALVGHSREVQPKTLESLLDYLRTIMDTEARPVKDWDEWRSEVSTNRPALLVAFPHNEGKEEEILLEIGGTKLFTLGLQPDYVRIGEGPPAVVLLLGCDVVGTAQDFSNHILSFRQAGAAVVVSTIATVFGPHAVRVGESMVKAMTSTDLTANRRLGDVIRDVKRRALLDSVPMALCVVAFGDAGWKL